ncbi:MAG: hypothetical protein JW902_19815 [Syntrophaceae bacterium]|nr:hypothetical protein [Syntrophaceae bacterium]
MAVDECKYSFAQLAYKVLPDYMKKLRRNMENPMPMSKFAENGKGVASILREYDISKDFKGCYVLIRNKKPIYVGISQRVFNRLRQHVLGRTHFDASLAYRIAAQKCPHKMTRSKAMKDQKFLEHFNAAKRYIRGLKAASIEIDNHLELYLFEAYCAMELDTSKHNTFETH